jgi:hypothetical protein
MFTKLTVSTPRALLEEITIRKSEYIKCHELAYEEVENYGEVAWISNVRQNFRRNSINFGQTIIDCFYKHVEYTLKM